MGSYSQNAEAVTLNFDCFFLSRRPSVLSESHQAEVGTAEFNLFVCLDSLFILPKESGGRRGGPGGENAASCVRPGVFPPAASRGSSTVGTTVAASLHPESVGLS